MRDFFYGGQSVMDIVVSQLSKGDDGSRVIQVHFLLSGHGRSSCIGECRSSVKGIPPEAEDRTFSETGF